LPVPIWTGRGIVSPAVLRLLNDGARRIEVIPIGLETMMRNTAIPGPFIGQLVSSIRSSFYEDVDHMIDVDPVQNLVEPSSLAEGAASEYENPHYNPIS
jgi:hypothetical protein